MSATICAFVITTVLSLTVEDISNTLDMENLTWKVSERSERALRETRGRREYEPLN